MFRRHTKKTIYILILAIPFLLFFLKPRNNKALTKLDSATLMIGIFDTPFQELKKMWYYRESYEGYVQFKKRNEVLKSKLVALNNILNETQRKQLLEDFRRHQKFTSVIAEVIGRDPTSWNATLIVNRGERDGIKTGMPVVTSLGVVGRIAEVGRTTSKVIMLADPNFAIAAVVSRSRESGLLIGSLQGLCRLQYLTDGADVKVGDQVVTSKLSSEFPQGLLIGHVVEVKAAALSHSVDCYVAPAVDLSQIDDVIIIKGL